MPRLVPTNPIAAGMFAYTPVAEAFACTAPPAARLPPGPTGHEWPPRPPPRRRPAGSADQAPGNAERDTHDAVLLELMGRRIALARRGAPRAPDVGDARHRRARAGRVVETVPDRAPRPHVLRLLLRPDDLLEPRQAGDQLGDRVDRERIELLQPGNGDARRAGARAVADDVVVDLAAAEDEPAHIAAGARDRESPARTSRSRDPRASTRRA